MLTLLCAPSSAGKSTFYKSGALERFLGLASRPPIIFAYEIPGRDLTPEVLVHYNLMRPFHAAHGSEAAPSPRMNVDWSFEADPAWRHITALPGEKQAIILVASHADLLTRCRERQQVEPGILEEPGVYQSDVWSAIYEHANLQAIYSLFLRECERQQIAVRFVLSKHGAFDEISEADVFPHLRDPRAIRYSADEVRDFTKGPSFEYQSLRLPHGIETHGDDRSDTAEIVLPHNLSGKSVLDIGSALGAVAFEAERRGAANVVGLEPRESRFEAAIILKEILSSNCEFRREDLASFLGSAVREGRGGFDYVLLLNVVHHMADPIVGLMQCSSLTRDTLAVEFPTLSDPIFAGVPADLAERLNDMPLMGVSTRGADQTFLFTPLALQRVLMDHRSVFKSVDFVPSPKAHRAIALFRK